MHWMQRERLKNLDKIREWVGKTSPEKIDRLALTRKAVLVLGCTRQRAIEYIQEVLGDW